MRGRDPAEPHRSTTPLELLFDLTFVVAVARAAAELRAALGQGQTGHALAGYALIFYALWWAWVNSTWFASAYDTDDVPYRLLTLLQMAGALIFSAGVPAAFGHSDYVTVVAGYVVMRMALVTQTLRAAHDHPAGRALTVRYAALISVVQLAWIGWLTLTGPMQMAGFAVLALAELVIPSRDQRPDSGTPWHPGHIAERYGQFTIIVLGEVISAIAATFGDAVTDKSASPDLITIAVAGLLLVFAMWWSYFRHDSLRDIRREIGESVLRTFLRSLGHYLIFASVAAVGAGLQVETQSLTHGAHVTPRFAAYSVAIPVAVYIVALAFLSRDQAPRATAPGIGVLTAVLVVAAAAATPLVTLPAVAVIIVVLVTFLLIYYLARDRTPLRQPPPT